MEIRHTDENADGSELEYWSAREALGVLGYARWENLEAVIRKARSACRNSGCDPGDHFRDVTKMIDIGKGGQRGVVDVQMTRYGMYLLAMNGDPDKSEIATAQTYFAVQTYRAERLLPAPAPAVTPPPPQPVEAEAPRRWAERLRRTFNPHLADLRLRHPGCFSVVSAAIADILSIEDELLRHLMTTRSFDRPDISIGLRWSTHRKENGMPEVTRTAELHLPDQQITVKVRVYAGQERAQFDQWFGETYLTRHLGYYLDHKKELKPFGQLPRASVADNASRSLAGRPAELTEPIRAQLAAAGGFVPAPRQLPAGPSPRRLPPRG